MAPEKTVHDIPGLIPGQATGTYMVLKKTVSVKWMEQGWEQGWVGGRVGGND